MFDSLHFLDSKCQLSLLLITESLEAMISISLAYRVRCHYNVVQYIAVQYRVILHATLQWLRHNINQSLYSQKTPHISTSWVTYGVSVVKIWETMDPIIMAPHCITRLRWVDVSPGPVFCLLLGVSSGCARPITGQVTSVTWPVIGQA